MKTKLILTIVTTLMIISFIVPIYAENESNIENVNAKVVEIIKTEEIEESNKPTKRIENVRVRILEGEYENEEYDMSYLITEDIENITSNIELKEEEKILVELEEKDGEIINISYIETINSSYILYIIEIILIAILLIISRKRATMIYLLTIILIGSIIVFSLQYGWNLILVSIILSALMTTILFISINGFNKQIVIITIRALLGISIAGILIYLLFDIMNLTSLDIKVAKKFINIREIVCSATILFSSGIYNAIAISGQYIFYANNRPYKTKSDNIIKGQRSLKL